VRLVFCGFRAGRRTSGDGSDESIEDFHVDTILAVPRGSLLDDSSEGSTGFRVLAEIDADEEVVGPHSPVLVAVLETDLESSVGEDLVGVGDTRGLGEGVGGLQWREKTISLGEGEHKGKEVASRANLRRPESPCERPPPPRHRARHH
jgi:hypothetical protein